MSKTQFRPKVEIEPYNSKLTIWQKRDYVFINLLIPFVVFHDMYCRCVDWELG